MDLQTGLGLALLVLGLGSLGLYVRDVRRSKQTGKLKVYYRPGQEPSVTQALRNAGPRTLDTSAILQAAGETPRDTTEQWLASRACDPATVGFPARPEWSRYREPKEMAHRMELVRSGARVTQKGEVANE